MTKRPSSGETSAVVTYAHRYKPPPRKQQGAPLAGSAVVTTKSSRRPVWGETAAELNTRSASPQDAGEAALSVARPAADDDTKLAPTHEAGDRRGEVEAPHQRRPAASDGAAAVPQADRARRRRLQAAEGRDDTTTARRDELMPARPVPGIEVVTVQQALYPPGGDALIFDRDRKHLQQRPLTAAERHMMAGKVLAFFQASWNTSSRRWTLLERAADGSW
jgi:hypothetical protein